MWGEPLRCALCRSNESIELHHNLIVGGKQHDSPKTIMPLCELCHAQAGKYKEKLDFIMLSRMTDKEAEGLSTVFRYKDYKHYLGKKYN